MDKVAEIKRLYLHATRSSIERDIARAVALLKQVATDEERERAAVYMDGLSQMRSEWALQAGRRRNSDARTGRQRP
jgi:hypothetical protein